MLSKCYSLADNAVCVWLQALTWSNGWSATWTSMIKVSAWSFSTPRSTYYYHSTQRQCLSLLLPCCPNRNRRQSRESHSICSFRPTSTHGDCSFSCPKTVSQHSRSWLFTGWNVSSTCTTAITMQCSIRHLEQKYYDQFFVCGCPSRARATTCSRLDVGSVVFGAMISGKKGVEGGLCIDKSIRFCLYCHLGNCIVFMVCFFRSWSSSSCSSNGWSWLFLSHWRPRTYCQKRWNLLPLSSTCNLNLTISIRTTLHTTFFSVDTLFLAFELLGTGKYRLRWELLEFGWSVISNQEIICFARPLAVYLCKRTMQNKTRLELTDYEAENLARLQKCSPENGNLSSCKPKLNQSMTLLKHTSGIIGE